MILVHNCVHYRYCARLSVTLSLNRRVTVASSSSLTVTRGGVGVGVGEGSREPVLPVGLGVQGVVTSTSTSTSTATSRAHWQARVVHHLLPAGQKQRQRQGLWQHHVGLATQAQTPTPTPTQAQAATSKCAAAVTVKVLDFPEDRNSSFMRGPALAPPLIRKEYNSDAINKFSELGVDLADSVDFAFTTGDSSAAAVQSPSQSSAFDSETLFAAIKPRLRAVLQSNKNNNRHCYPLTLGGDHSISFPLCRAIAELVGAPLIIVHFDAHPDIYPEFEGSLSSHACPFARIMETSGVCRHLTSVGIRTMTKVQQEQVARFGVQVVQARQFPAFGGDLYRVWRGAKVFTDNPENSLVYVSIDLDVLEPGLAPGLSHREPGGLTVRQLIDAIHCIPGRIIGGDIVEYNPSRDVDNITACVAAKVLKELASKIIISNTGCKPLIVQ